METKFRVVMKKDDEVIKDFISFTYRAQGQKGRLKVRAFGIAMLLISVMAYNDGNTTPAAIMAGVGAFTLLITLIFPKIAVARLKKADEGYKKGTEYEYVFAGGSMYVYENGELDKNVGGYAQVSCFYGDEKNYYVGINNDDLYLLPKKCFVEGDAEEFLEFIQRKSNEVYEFLPLTLKNKWLKYRTESKVKEAEYDAKAAAKRAEAAEKKAKRKQK